jgi:hypothetical protein
VSELSPDAAVLVASTFLGGVGGFEGLWDLALLPDGSVVACGETKSSDFPVTAGALQHTYGGNFEGFVTHFNAGLTQLVGSTFIGKSKLDKVSAVAPLPDGNLLLAGPTTSPDFPVTPGAFGKLLNGVGASSTSSDLFLMRVTPDLGTMLSSTFLGGGLDEDFKLGLAVDSAGAATVVGTTFFDSAQGARPFPTTSGAFANHLAESHSGTDMFLARVSPDGSRLTYSTYYGGTQSEDNESFTTPAVALTPEGDAVIAAHTLSTDLPLGIPDPWDKTLAGSFDTFVARFDMLPTGVTRHGASTPGCEGVLAISAFEEPTSGGGLTLSSTGEPPSSNGWLLLSPGAPGSPIQAAGIELWVDPQGMVVMPVGSDAHGYCEAAVHGLTAGLVFHAQFVWPKDCPVDSWSSTAALDIVVQP